MKMLTIILLLSGGIDSATALWLYKRKYNVHALSFKYGNDNRNEIRAAKKLARMAGSERHLVADVGFLKEYSELPEYGIPILRKPDIPPSYVPSRNTIFFGIASYYSEIFGAKYIVTGHNYMDPFPDTKPEYVRAMNDVLSYGSWLGKKYKTKIVMPLSKMDKTSVVRLALQLQVPLELTWSCHQDGKLSCGKCDGCTSRLEAFHNLGVEDRIGYELHNTL